MIRPWGCRTNNTTGQLLAFHELEDDVDDNARVGRALHDEDSTFSSVSSDDGTKSINGMSSTPMLGATPSLFTNFWSLSIPVLPRPFASRSRPTEPPRQSSQSPRRYRQKRGCAQHHQPPEEGGVNISQEWREAAKYLDSVILQPPVTTTSSSSTQESLGNTQVSVEDDDDDEEIVPQLGIAASPFQTAHLRITALVTPPSTPPFCDGHCSTIVAATPETRVVVQTDYYSDPDFVESPPPPPPPVLPLQPVTPDNTSEHSNPPYIRPVGTRSPAGIEQTTTRTVVSNNKHRPAHNNPSLSSTHPHYPSQGSTGGEQVHLGTDLHLISHHPPPKAFWSIPSDCGSTNHHRTMDDVSSLGGDSLGDTPSRVFHTHLHQEHFKNLSHAMETPAQQHTTTSQPQQSKGGGWWCCCCCCLAWLPIWMRRIPRVLRYALFVGTALWFAAVALVVLAIVMGRSRNGAADASSAARDWQDAFTLPPAVASGLAPTASPRTTLLPTASTIPTDEPTLTSEPTLTFAPSQQTATPTANPSTQPSATPTMKPATSRPTAAPTMAPSIFATTAIPVPPTQFPTFEPRGMKKDMGMRRDRSRVRRVRWAG
eukprot:scaffold482_cov266-Amphora_coffeaeformis.AAC.61